MSSSAAVLGDSGRSLAGDGEAGRDPLSISAEVKASLSLLIVDDDRTLREGCASVLQMDGFNVTTLGRGDEALELVRRRKFDIVLVDLYMTPVSGMEILRATLSAH
jgi:DNA-binding NtrC family response regulator